MEIKIKWAEENEIVLSESEAREIYTRLKNLFDSNYTITYPNYSMLYSGNPDIWHKNTIG